MSVWSVIENKCNRVVIIIRIGRLRRPVGMRLLMPIKTGSRPEKIQKIGIRVMLSVERTQAVKKVFMMILMDRRKEKTIKVLGNYNYRKKEEENNQIS